MRRFWIPAILMTALGVAPSIAQTASTAPKATAAHYTTADTDIGTLLDDPAAKAVLAKHVPDLVKSDQVDMARSLTLQSLQNYSPDTFTDEKLKAIDADLAKLPVKK